MSDENVVSAKEFVKTQIKNVLGVLINEKQKEENKKIGRELSITITEIEKALAYFQLYVENYLEE